MVEMPNSAVADAKAQLALGVQALAGRDLSGAIAHFEAARAADPYAVEPCFHLGAALQVAGRSEEAVAVLTQGLRIDPNRAALHNDLGVALHSLSRLPEALEHLRRAIALQPGAGDAYSNVGNLLMELGLIEAAHAACLSAIAIAPAKGIFYFNLANVRRFVAADRLIAKMEALAADPAAQTEDDLIALHFALGKAYDDCGEVERSMAHWQAGNALKRRAVVYDEAATLGALDRVRRAFDRPMPARATGDPSRLPVFVLGMPRSGTTLVEQILASHPRVHGAGELYALEQVVTALGDGYPESVGAMAEAELAGLGKHYLERLDVPRPDAERVTDKMPSNFRYIGLIRRILPNARIVHVARDPFATCMSCFSRLFTRHQEFSYELGELGRHYRAYRALMDHWARVLPAGAMLEVRYEELIADFEAQARRIVAYCGLEWNESCLAFHRNARPVRTASAVQVRQPVYADSVGRWRRYRALAAPLLEALGPELAGAP